MHVQVNQADKYNKTSMIDLSVVVPCFNEMEMIDVLYVRLSDVCRSCVGKNYEIVLVDDGSIDTTWMQIEELSKSDPHVVGIRLSRNYGHQIALTAGLFSCRGQRVFVIDADLQDPPELLTDMMHLMDKGADVVYGKRTSRQGETWFKKVSASFFYRILDWMTDVDIPTDTGDFRLMDRKVVEVFKSMPEQYRFIRGMVAWTGFNQIAIPYERLERRAGNSKYPLKRMVGFAIDAITSFSNLPLRISLYLSLISMILSFVMLLYVIYAWVVLNTVQGWASLMAVILIFNSIQMFLLGAIGEYVGRIYLESKRRPLFVIRQISIAAPSEESQAFYSSILNKLN